MNLIVAAKPNQYMFLGKKGGINPPKMKYTTIP
jgi:hypothetical protein